MPLADETGAVAEDGLLLFNTAKGETKFAWGVLAAKILAGKDECEDEDEDGGVPADEIGIEATGSAAEVQMLLAPTGGAEDVA